MGYTARIFTLLLLLCAGPALKVLSVTQRLRLDPPKLEEVSRRISQVGATGHCVLLALPTGEDIELDSSFQRRPLKSLVTYFKKKEAAEKKEKQ